MNAILFPYQIQNRTVRIRTLSDDKASTLIEVIKDRHSLTGIEVLSLMSSILEYFVNLISLAVDEYMLHRFYVQNPMFAPPPFPVDYFESTREHFIMVKDQIVNWQHILIIPLLMV